MKNKNTIKDLINLMEKNGENKDFIIGWLSSMIDCRADGVWPSDVYSLQDEINSGINHYQKKTL
jgi:hypothetical protein